METKQVTVQPAVGGMIKASKDSFVIPKEELPKIRKQSQWQSQLQ